jgi:hypothetical protein
MICIDAAKPRTSRTKYHNTDKLCNTSNNPSCCTTSLTDIGYCSLFKSVRTRCTTSCSTCSCSGISLVEVRISKCCRYRITPAVGPSMCGAAYRATGLQPRTFKNGVLRLLRESLRQHVVSSGQHSNTESCLQP